MIDEMLIYGWDSLNVTGHLCFSFRNCLTPLINWFTQVFLTNEIFILKISYIFSNEKFKNITLPTCLFISLMNFLVIFFGGGSDSLRQKYLKIKIRLHCIITGNINDIVLVIHILVILFISSNFLGWGRIFLRIYNIASFVNKDVYFYFSKQNAFILFPCLFGLARISYTLIHINGES